MSLLEVELGNPWESFELEVDEIVNNFYYLADLIKQSINNYLESVIARGIMHQKILKPNQNIPLKFARSNGMYFATMLKSVLLHNFSGGNAGGKDFTSIEWPWLKYTSIENFIEVLQEALTLWDSVHKMVQELAEKSKLDFIENAFSNANYVLKSKLHELNVVSLLK